MSLYYYHCENLRQIENGINLVSRNLKDSLSKKYENEVNSYTRLLTYLLSCWTEVRLYKIVEETYSGSTTGPFTDSQKSKILDKRKTLEGKWKDAISIAMCQAFDIPETIRQDTIKQHLNSDLTNRKRYINIMDCLNNELSISIQLRNKIAHGQWVYALNSHNSAINENLTTNLHDINIVKIQLQHKMYKSLANIIHDLVVSPATFERDFEKNYKALVSNRDNFHKRDYESYKTNMVKMYEQGKEKRIANFRRI